MSLLRAVLIVPLLAGSIGASSLASRTTDDVVLAVPGRSNQTPWAATLGETVAVAWGASTSDGATDVFVAVSRDGAMSFGEPVRVNAIGGEARLGGELPPRVALIDREGRDPEIVVAYGSKIGATAIKLARSTDGGRTFREGLMLQAPGAAGDRGWHALAIGASGDAHVLWLDHRGLAAQKAQSHEHHEKAAIDGVAMAQHSGLYYRKVGDPEGSPLHRDRGVGDPSGLTSRGDPLGLTSRGDPLGSPEESPERQLFTGVCYCCKVAMATMPGGGIAAAWRHVYEGNIRDIAFSISRDDGGTFSPPARVSADGWQLAGCPDDGPAMAVDSDGTVHVVWPTVVGGDTPEGAIFYASSRDGRTFTARQRVPTLGSPRPMHPQIAVGADGRITVAWDEVVNGVRQGALRELAFDADGRAIFGEVTRLSGPESTSSYPVLMPTSRGMLTAFVSGKAGESVVRVVR